MEKSGALRNPGLRLLIAPLDWASIPPDWIRVDAVDAVNVSMANTSASIVAPHH